MRKIAKISFVSGGRILITFADGKMAILDTAGIQAAQLLGVTLKAGVEVNTEDSVNPVSGETSKDWVRLLAA